MWLWGVTGSDEGCRQLWLQFLSCLKEVLAHPAFISSNQEVRVDRGGENYWAAELGCVCLDVKLSVISIAMKRDSMPADFTCIYKMKGLDRGQTLEGHHRWQEGTRTWFSPGLVLTYSSLSEREDSNQSKAVPDSPTTRIRCWNWNILPFHGKYSLILTLMAATHHRVMLEQVPLCSIASS